MTTIVNGGIDQQIQAAPANSMTSLTINQVIGNKADANLSGPGTDSLYGIAGFMLYHHVHSPSLVYPRDAAPITLTAGTGAYTEGAKTQIIAAETKTNAFDIHYVILGAISAVDDYVVKIYQGAEGEEVFWGECSFFKDTNQVRGSDVPIQGPPIAAGTRISATLMSGTGDTTVNVKIYTHEYTD